MTPLLRELYETIRPLLDATREAATATNRVWPQTPNSLH